MKEKKIKGKNSFFNLLVISDEKEKKDQDLDISLSLPIFIPSLKKLDDRKIIH